ncbi:MAG: enolase C-terminal domain-like protein, partial [candidate division FCPU426 bacterium]
MKRGGKILGMELVDVRYPTSASGIGSDAVHTSPDYSAAYVILKAENGEGHGLTFTVGDGNQICIAALQAFRPHIVGKTLEDITSDFGAFWRSLANEPQLRWLGPEKGVIHLALGALINAVWDLWAKVEGKPVWKLLTDLPPAELLRCIDFRYIEDALPKAEALEMLQKMVPGRAEREKRILAEGYPAYNTSIGWMGYSDEKVKRLCQEALAEGWTAFKMKVGGALESDLRRMEMVRAQIGWDKVLMTDANQNWGVSQAIEACGKFQAYKPLWIEEPTSPDDILGHKAIREAVRPIKVATGEHCQNRVIFKQLFQAGAIDYCQIDACRLGGVNEVLAVLLMAAKFKVPVCPHAGGIGLCEYVQHLSIFDYIAVTGAMDGRWIEFVDHLHE